MIQDIYPARFDNVFKDRRPDTDSFVCYFKEGELLARCAEDRHELSFPRYAEFPEGTDAIYMFSIDAQAFFLVLEAEALPEGYETVIGEGGASLSGGEKQRISIARAMMKDAPVIFLDEATANVDPENENDLMKAIQALTEEKTVIMIAHRLKTVEHADQILVIDHGKIVQQGTHENLMKEEGIYRNFISERREAASWKVKQK